ncbi:SRPBCC family protein [Ensifer sp. IC3342]|nr:SRPBCC family protein [Ensifer sp. BRP08]MCA1445912.1 SRPBCC family protein [Ensifer sp. IC3342]
MTTPSAEHASFTIERIFKAPPEQVFHAFADPETNDRWFVKADNWPVAEYQHDFRVGGRERGRFSQDGKIFYFNETIYLDIVENSRIVLAYTMAKDDRRISGSIATVDLLPEGDGTRVIFTEQAAFLDGLDKVEYRREGWEQLIGFLAAELGENADVAA